MGRKIDVKILVDCSLGLIQGFSIVGQHFGLRCWVFGIHSFTAAGKIEPSKERHVEGANRRGDIVDSER